jgi:hypothetical protein
MPDLTERHRLIYSPHAALHEIETVSTLMHSIGRLVEADAKLPECCIPCGACPDCLGTES